MNIRNQARMTPDGRNFYVPFTAAKNPYLSKEFAPRVTPILQELAGGRMTEVQFVAA
jgi:hypothetical protein